MTGARASLYVAALALTASLAVSGSAHAAFEIVGDPNQPNRGNSVMVDGFGRDLPVEVVTEQVVPPQFAVSFGADVNRTEITSWQGGRPWRQVLGDSLAPLGLTFTESDRSILITRTVQAVPAPHGMQQPGYHAHGGQMAHGGQCCAPHQPQAPVAAAPQPMHPHAQQYNMAKGGHAPAHPQYPAQHPGAQQYAAAKGDVMMHHAPAQPVQPMPQAPEEWIAPGGSTLKNTLVQWGDRAGWAIAWDSERDYRLEASATFYGDFETAAANLLRVFSVAQPPVRATIFRGNRVVVVKTGRDNEDPLK
ncbi:MAG: hypothetical protein Alpg2KO_02030 [Alphaproteobacteria bacterium]